MFDHIGLRTAKFESSKQFFITALAPLGIAPAVEYPGGVGFARDRGQVQRLSSCCAALHLAKSLPFTDKSMKMGSLSVNGPPEKYRLRTKWSKTAVCP